MSDQLNRRTDRGNGREGLDFTQPLHPSLEAFAQAMADILVERHLERKRAKMEEHDVATVKTPGDSYRRGTDETRRNARRR